MDGGSMQRNSRPFGLVVAIAILAIVAIGSSGEAKESPERRTAAPQGTRIGTLSGNAFMHLCADVWPGGAVVETMNTTRCVGYLQGVIDALESLKAGTRVPYCLPDDFTAEHGIHLFKQEAKVFPQVLDRPASDLIAGMFVKFFPC
jgi:hypothetical protein